MISANCVVFVQRRINNLRSQVFPKKDLGKSFSTATPVYINSDVFFDFATSVKWHEEIERLVEQRPELRQRIEVFQRSLRRLKLLLVFVSAVLIAIPLASIMRLFSIKTALLTFGSVVAALAFSLEWMRRCGKLTFYTARARKPDER